jgi:hypothetical protein
VFCSRHFFGAKNIEFLPFFIFVSLFFPSELISDPSDGLPDGAAVQRVVTLQHRNLDFAIAAWKSRFCNYSVEISILYRSIEISTYVLQLQHGNLDFAITAWKSQFCLCSLEISILLLLHGNLDFAIAAWKSRIMLCNYIMEISKSVV